MGKKEMANQFNRNKPRSDFLDDEVSSEAWSASALFSKSKIATPLIALDIFEDMARFGTQNVEEQLNYPPSKIALMRHVGITRLASKMSQLLGNVDFGILKNDVKKLEGFLIAIDEINKYLYMPNFVIKYKPNMMTHQQEIIIVEENFNLCLDKLVRIKNKVNKIINNAGLIFRSVDEIDIDKMMSDIALGG